MAGPTVGQVVDGYRFRGGDPNNQTSWEQVAPVAAPDYGASAQRLPNGQVIQRGPRGGITVLDRGGGTSGNRAGQLSAQERKELSEARTSASLVDTTLSDLQRFQRLQGQQKTGGGLAIPFAREVAGAFDPQVAEMNEITARLAPAQREPGSGTTSDRDLALFLQAVPGAQRPGQANNAIIDRGLQEGARRQLRSEFLDRFAQQNGTLAGSGEAWRENYQPPPVRAGTPVPRGNVEPTSAQRATINRLNQSGSRNRRATLGSRENPRVPPEGFDISSLPAGDWYVTPQGQVQQVSRGRANQALRSRSNQTRSGVVSVRRLD